MSYGLPLISRYDVLQFPTFQNNFLQMVQDNASCSLIIGRTFVEDTGIYTVRAVNGAGQAETSAKLTVESKP